MEYRNCNVTTECEGISITGGYVYRGSHADWDGVYFFGDWSARFDVMDGRLFAGRQSNGEWTMESVDVAAMETKPYILAFGQDNDGEVYMLTTEILGPVGAADKIYRIVP
jgi:hypothetical protein